VPRPDDLDAAADDELLGIDIERSEPRDLRTAHPVLAAFLPGSPLLPIALRTLVGAALAGYVAYGIGVGRPYWAIVTAVALFQANVTLTWRRAVQRVVGNLGGVAVFAAIAPVARLAPVALVLLVLALSFLAEPLMARNYWMGSVCVTPMALLIGEFGQAHAAGELIGDRIADTLVGAVLGMLAAFAVLNRRAGDRIEHRLAALEEATGRAAAVLDAGAAGADLRHLRRGLYRALVELRLAADAAAGEWRRRDLPEQRVVEAEREGHRTLAAMVRRQGPAPPREAPERDGRAVTGGTPR
jgi:uncharacterized membrane protein YccC